MRDARSSDHHETPPIPAAFGRRCRAASRRLSVAWAQAYPTRPVRIIVPFAPGGPTDVAARLIAQKLSESLGRNFLVENVAGASSNIGTAQAAKAAPDGYTLLITVNNLVINPSLFDKVAFDPYKDFDPIGKAVGFSSAFAVHPSVPAKTVKELIEVIKANPGQFSYASPGSARRRICSASSSASPTTSTSCTSPMAAAARRSPRRSRATRRSASPRCRRRRRRRRPASCACSRC